MQRWEYRTELLEADAHNQREFLGQLWPDQKPGKNSPRALIPLLNERGADGWELISMQPVFAGVNADILVHEGTGTRWSATYLCTFKRPIETT
jgi:hypothetical protein